MPIVADVLIVGFFAYKIWIGPYRARKKRLAELAKTFDMTFDDDSVAKTIQRGHQIVAAKILIGHTTELGRFSFRFVRTVDGGNESPAEVSITKITVQRNPSPDGLQEWSDEKGGRYGRWPTPQRFDQGEVLHFDLEVTASTQWSGYLSFRSHDADGKVRYTRKQFSFSDLA